MDKIINDITFVMEHTNNLSAEQFSKDEVLLDSVMFRLVQIAENALKLTQIFRQRHDEVDWQAIIGMRNRIVHDYGRVDLSVIYQTVRVDLPKLREQLLEF